MFCICQKFRFQLNLADPQQIGNILSRRNAAGAGQKKIKTNVNNAL